MAALSDRLKVTCLCCSALETAYFAVNMDRVSSLRGTRSCCGLDTHAGVFLEAEGPAIGWGGLGVSSTSIILSKKVMYI